MAESSVSKSVSASSTYTEQLQSIKQGRVSFVDKCFPILDQMMMHSKWPDWILSLVSIFVLSQILSIGFWIYTPIYKRTTGKWTEVYKVILEIFTFQNPIDTSKANIIQLIICIVFAAFTFLWICAMVYYNKVFYQVPKFFLYITSLLVDIIDPVFITPSVYLINHGITSLRVQFSVDFILEIVFGAISYVTVLLIFNINTNLKSRSVVLTSLLFPMFDCFSVTIWINLTSFASILTAIFVYLNSWFDCVLGVVYVIFMLYICYRLIFIPFYDIWRNSIAMSFGITSIVTVVYFFILYFTEITYNYTIIVFVSSMILCYIFTHIYYTNKVKKIKGILTLNPEIPDINEEYDRLKVTENSYRAMMYTVVGVSKCCDHYVDGSISNYVLNIGHLDSALSMMLQLICFFPSESRKMEILLKKVLLKRKLNIIERFLVYQVCKIKTRRLVSDTKETLDTFNKLKQRNDSIKSIIRSFWDSTEATNQFLSGLSVTVNDLDAKFQACLSDNPNNLRLCLEYSNFLIECKCEFENAIKESIKAEMIGNGKNFNVDVSFKSAVNKFPGYLKQKILDPKGRRIQKGYSTEKVSSTSSNSGSKGSTNSFESTEIDFERQELVSKQILKDSKVRLAFHHAIRDTKPYQYNMIIFNITMDVIVILVFYIGFYSFVVSEMSWRKTSYKDLSFAGYATFYNIYGSIYMTSKFAQQADRLNTSTALLGNITIDNGNAQELFQTSLPLQQRSYLAINQSNYYMRYLLDSLAEQGQVNSPFNYAGVLLDVNQSSFTVCDGGSPYTKVNSSLKSNILTLNYEINFLAANFEKGIHYDNIFTTVDYCHILSNLPRVGTDAEKTYKSLLDYNVDKASSYKTQIIIWMVLGPIFIIVTLGVSAIVIIATYNAKVDKIIKILLSLPNEVKEEAKKKLMISNEEQDLLNTHEKVKNSYVMDLVADGFFLVMFICAAVFIVFGYLTLKMNNNLTMILQWFYYSCKRLSMASEIGNNALLLVLLNGSLSQTIIDRNELQSMTLNYVQNLVETQQALLYGNNEIKQSVGFDEELDNMNVGEHCDLGRNPSSVHDMYACAGIDSLIQIFKQMITEIINHPDHFGGAINNEVGANMQHLLRVHFYPSVMKASQRIAEIMEETYNKAVDEDKIFLAIGFICAVIVYSIPWIFRDFIIKNYRMLLMLFQHLPMQTIIETPEILEIFTGKKSNNHNERMSTNKSIVMDASECIIVTNQASVVEIINQSVTANLGMTPDQMLGQQFANFVAEKDQKKINQQIEMMVNGQGSLFWEDHLELIDDSEQPVPFLVNMIGMKDNENSNDIKSIVFILMNETEEIEKRKAAEQAKAKSEKLLYQILPKDIVVRLNRGETDISFTINSATIFFIDIVKFSSYTSHLTPSEIMANLGQIFAGYDRILAQYSTITKIKLIGDDYMAAAGLFMTEEDDKTKHAEEAVRCCIECVKSIEEINLKLNSSLEVRCGVNSGGPLIGGVLGTDKPTFDIIGDPINVAARLQSTDIPGYVQISEETKSLIENLDFSIEERGEVFLKGKGMRKTYFATIQQKNPDFEGSFTMNLQNLK